MKKAAASLGKATNYSHLISLWKLSSLRVQFIRECPGFNAKNSTLLTVKKFYRDPCTLSDWLSLARKNSKPSINQSEARNRSLSSYVINVEFGLTRSSDRSNTATWRATIMLRPKSISHAGDFLLLEYLCLPSW